jgi:hypothetical protein
MPVIVSSSAGGQTVISGSAMSSSAGNYLSGSTTVTGSLFVTGSLTVSGSNTFVNYGSFVSNADSTDNDSRFAAVGNDNMLYVDAGNARVGVGTSTPTSVFSVNGDAVVTGSTTLSSSATDQGTIDLYLGSGQTRFVSTYMDNEYGDDWLQLSNNAGRINISASLSIELMGNPEDDGVMVTNSPFGVSSIGEEDQYATTLFSVEEISGSIYTSGSLAIGMAAGDEGHMLALDVHYTGSAEASGSRPGNLGHDTGGGEVVYFGTASAGLSTGALYYLNADGGWQSADSANTGSGHNQLLAIALGDKPGGTGMLLKGYFHVDSYLSGAFIVGGPLYIQSSSIDRLHTEGGYLSGAAPSATDSYVRVVGYGISSSAPQAAHVIYFNPDATYVEIG